MKVSLIEVLLYVYFQYAECNLMGLFYTFFCRVSEEESTIEDNAGKGTDRVSEESTIADNAGKGTDRVSEESTIEDYAGKGTDTER